MSLSHVTRTTSTSLTVVALFIAGCAKGAEKAANADSNAGSGPASPASDSAHAGMQMPATQAATPAPSTTPAGKQKPKVDPKNVGASIVWDAATKTVTIPVVSGLTANAGGWNFNGYAQGQMRIIVPVGAKVVMQYYNDDIVPHSAIIVAGTASTVPSAPSAPVFGGATTTRGETGLMTGGSDEMRFTADKAGKYLLVCGIPGHALSGMWDWFEVSASAKAPSVKIGA